MFPRYKSILASLPHYLNIQKELPNRTALYFIRNTVLQHQHNEDITSNV